MVKKPFEASFLTLKGVVLTSSPACVVIRSVHSA